MAIYYIKIDTDKRDIQMKRGRFGVWWIGWIGDLTTLASHGWPCVDYFMSDVPARRKEQWHVMDNPDCRKLRKMREEAEEQIAKTNRKLLGID